MTNFPHLMAPGQIGPLELRNRILMAPMGDVLCNDDGTVSDNQLAYFEALRAEVKKYARKPPEEMKAAVDGIKKSLQANERTARYVGDGLASQVEKVYLEMGGKPFGNKQAAAEEHWRHAESHGRQLARQTRP